MIFISGLCDDWRVQRCRSLAAGLNVEYEVRAMLAADWEKHLATTALSVPAVTAHATSPLVLLGDVYVGGLEAFEALATEEGLTLDAVNDAVLSGLVGVFGRAKRDRQAEEDRAGALHGRVPEDMRTILAIGLSQLQIPSRRAGRRGPDR